MTVGVGGREGVARLRVRRGDERRRALTAAGIFARPLVPLAGRPFPAPLLRTEAERSAADHTL